MQFPIDEIIPAITQTLAEHNQLIIEAPPGAGKTTVVPLKLLNQAWLKGNILVLEPRRMAARNVAHRMAELLEETVGQTVGYRIRQDQKISASTKIEVVTGGVLLNILQKDPALERYSCIIFDEFHERNLESDFALSLCLHARELFREQEDPLKLVVMSATLDSDRLGDFLQAPRLTSKGKSFPVDVFYQGECKASDLLEKLVNTITTAHQNHLGDILVFLPGQKEIENTLNRLRPLIDTNTAIYPLYGSLPFEKQLKAIAPASGRKIVLATDVAETSLTISGITVVIDSCLQRRPVFDPKTGLSRLKTQKISRASATQRAGRAGRLSAGVCYRLINQSTTLNAHASAEINNADLSSLCLQMLNYGVNSAAELPWMDAPPESSINSALDLLVRLGAVTQQHQKYTLTAHGALLSGLNTHPRLAHMMIIGKQFNLTEEACSLAATLMEGTQPADWSNDVEHWVDALLQRNNTQRNNTQRNKSHAAWFARVSKQTQTFINSLNAISVDSSIEAKIKKPIGLLIAAAYPDRIAKKRAESDQQYLLSSGRAASLPKDSSLQQNEWLACIEVGGIKDASEDKIFSAAEISEGDLYTHLDALISRTQTLEWDDEHSKIKATATEKIGAIIVKQTTTTPKADETTDQLIKEQLIKHELSFLSWTEEAIQLCHRATLVSQYNADFPACDIKSLSDNIDEWLVPFLDGIISASGLKKLDLMQILSTYIGWQNLALLDQLAPTHITVPSGFNIAIDYSQSPPVLKVKLQEMFGCNTTPTVAEGKIALAIHLLSPAGRPLQITQDLQGFWQTSYHEVKKEMKGRYPKHPWPDDPTTAQASRFTKNRIKNKS